MEWSFGAHSSLQPEGSVFENLYLEVQNDPDSLFKAVLRIYID